MPAIIDDGKPNRKVRYYRWYYEHIFSRCYDPAVKAFLIHFGGEDLFRKEMLSTIVFSEGEKVLDMCCGTGGLTLAVRRKAGPVAEITGLDQSDGQIKKAVKKNTFDNVIFIPGEASVSCLPQGYFDKVFIGHALHEMWREKRLAVLGEANRVMRDAGQLVVLEFDKPPSLMKRWWFGFWLGRWIPYPLNFETRTISDMLKSGLYNEVREAGFRGVRRLPKFDGTMQVVTAYK